MGLAQTNGSGPAGDAQSRPGDSGDWAQAIGKILVVDDNIDLADITGSLLTAHGLEALVAYSGREALDILASQPDVRVVVTDIVMPALSGIDLADQISEQYPSIKVVFMSGFVSTDVSRGLPLKHLLLSKPFKIQRLINVLEML